MRKIKIIYIFLLLLCSCQSKNSNDQSDVPDQYKISDNFLTVTSVVNHIDNALFNSQQINISFDSHNISASSNNMNVDIVPVIAIGVDKVTVEPSKLTLKLKDIQDHNYNFQLNTTGAKVGGNIKIKFIVNDVPQKSEFNSMLSHREIKAFALEPLYVNNAKVNNIPVEVFSDTPDDNFTVLFKSSGLDELTPSCTVNDFVDNISTSCEISFTIASVNPKLTAVIDDESKKELNADINVCDSNSNTLFFDKRAYDIDYKIATGIIGVPIKIYRCTNDIRSSLSAKLNFQNVSLKKVATDRAIEDIIGIKDTIDNKILFPAGARDIEITLVNKITGVDIKQIIDNFRYILPAKINITASASNYMSATAELDNRENVSPKIYIDSDVDVDQNSYATVKATRQNIDDFAINFCLTSQPQSVECDKDLDGKYQIIEDALNNTLKIDLVSKTINAGTYYLLGFLNVDKRTPVQLLGHNTVVVHAVESMQFIMKPELKHVLRDFPSFYYIGINNGEQQSKLTDNKIFLYYLDSSEMPANNNCSAIKLYKVDIDNPNSETYCTLGSKSDLGSCYCDLSDGLLSKNCVFRVDMSNTNYNNGDQCQLSVRTSKIFNANISTIQSTDGLKKISIQTNSNLFPSAGLLEMYNDGDTDSGINGNQLNDHWKTKVDSTNINDINGAVFQDVAMFEMKAGYFSASSSKDINLFTINNYPGRNDIDHTAQLPNNINFVLGWVIGDNYTWSANRCITNDPASLYPPHLGCYHGGAVTKYVNYTDYRGNANIPGNVIKINRDGIINFTETNLNLQPIWMAGLNNQVKLGQYTVSKYDNNTIRLNIKSV